MINEVFLGSIREDVARLEEMVVMVLNVLLKLTLGKGLGDGLVEGFQLFANKSLTVFE